MNRIYRKKPHLVEALQWRPHSKQEEREMLGWLAKHEVSATFNEDNSIGLPTLEGAMLALPGDYIIRGVADEFYPCKPHVFDATYERVRG